MLPLKKICEFLDGYAPTRLAEDWDNVGLLVGDVDANVSKVMTCLTITPETAQEAIDNGGDLIVTHHPLPFRSIKKVTTEQTSTRMLWELIRAGVAIYSPHTGFDSAAGGINQMVCQKMGLNEIEPLEKIPDEDPTIGSGRFGKLPGKLSLNGFLASVKEEFGLEQLQFVGDLTQEISSVASACGSGGSFLDKVIAAQCDAFITGEANFHSCLEAKARGVALVLVGHYASERFAIEELATILKSNFADLDVWAASQESDPVNWA